MKFDRNHSIVVESNKELRMKLLEAISRLGAHASYKGKPVRPNAFYSSIFVWLATLSDEELRDFIIPKLQALESQAD